MTKQQAPTTDTEIGPVAQAVADLMDCMQNEERDMELVMAVLNLLPWATHDEREVLAQRSLSAIELYIESLNIGLARAKKEMQS